MVAILRQGMRNVTFEETDLNGPETGDGGTSDCAALNAAGLVG